MRISPLVEDLLDLFLPRGCLACGSRIPPEEDEGLVCVRCRTLLRSPPPPRCSRCDVPLGTGHTDGMVCLECVDWPEILVSARAAVVMETPADSLIHALKYGGWRALGRIMGSWMSSVCPQVGRSPVLVPVPTTPARSRMRGYNQARVLAEVVGREVGHPVVDALRRPKGGTQVRMGPRERRANVQRAFQCSPPYRSRIRDAEVILIDDVLTTGATASAAASVLAEQGVASVHLLTFARALPFWTEARCSTLD